MSDDTFLTAQEKRVIQSNYETILDHLKVDEIILKLLQEGLITTREKSDLKFSTDYEKGQHIIDEVLFKATYENLCSIRNILIKSGHASHKVIAKILPTRGEKIDYNLSSKNSESVPDRLGSSFNDSRRGSDPGLVRPTLPVEEEQNNRWSHCESQPSQQLSSTNTDTIDQETFLEAAGPKGVLKTLKSSFRRKKSFSSTPNISSEIPSLRSYGVKPNNNEVIGKTLCVIIANFTDDLDGYEKDKASLVYLHKNILKHEFVYEGSIPGYVDSLNNLTREELIKALGKIAELMNPLSGIDRFFLYILSHGDEDGIMTCAKGSAKQVEGVDPKTQRPLKDPKTGKQIIIRTQLQEIVDMFTHDNVPCLKGFPKVFINQSCRGSELLRAAGPPGEDTVDLHKEVWHPPKAKVAIGADVLVCEATSASNYAWVAEQGSLYIQCLVQVIEQYYEVEHFYDMLVEVNNRLAHKVKKGINPADNSIVPASQMPSITSKLTKKFYLGAAHHRAHFYQ